jgi:hypothetical protein
MSSEFCPRCRAVKNVRITVARRKKRFPGGKLEEIETTSVHCNVCRSFIRGADAAVARADEKA